MSVIKQQNLEMFFLLFFAKIILIVHCQYKFYLAFIFYCILENNIILLQFPMSISLSIHVHVIVGLDGIVIIIIINIEHSHSAFIGLAASSMLSTIQGHYINR